MIKIHSYEIMLANGDRVYYNTEMSFADFKKMISENEFIEIEREPWVLIPNGWSSRPTKASYLTKSIVYVNWDKEWEEERRKWNEKLDKQKEIKNKILKYIPNFRIKWKYLCQFETLWSEDIYNHVYEESFLNEVLDYCKKYKCKKV